MSIADCSHDWNTDPTIAAPAGTIGMRCSRCNATAVPTKNEPTLAAMKYPGPGDPFNGLRPTKSGSGHVCREDIEASEPRPRCATCGQFVAFKPLEHGPDAWQAQAIERIRRERLRQDAKWGEQNHGPERWSLILTEETGEVAKAALERDHKAYIAELVQVAAVALAALECAARGAGTEEAQ